MEMEEQGPTKLVRGELRGALFLVGVMGQTLETSLCIQYQTLSMAE